MEQELIKVNKKLFVLLLICLVVFFLFPKIILAEDFEDITPQEIGKYLELPRQDVQNLIYTLRQVLTTEGIYLWSSGYTTDEQIAAAVILLNVVKVEVLNHLLVDAPVEVTWKIINNAVKIARLFGIQDVSVVLHELEKESVKKAIDYGMKTLLENEIRVTPGAIKFRYFSYKGGEKEVIFQYIMIYKPMDIKRGEIEVRFYSSEPIDPPDPEKFSKRLPIPNLYQKLPPFIVEIKGVVEKTELDTYRWTEGPSVKIDFPESVPDLGIKPLSFWERQIWKPIIAQVKEVEVIITKATGKSLNIVEGISNIQKVAKDVWSKITGKIQELGRLGGAQITPPPEEKPKVEVGQGVGKEKTVEEKVEKLEVKRESEESGGVRPRQPQQPESNPEERQLSLKEIQEKLADVSKKIDALKQRAEEITGDVKQRQEEEKKEEEEKNKVEKEEIKSEAVLCSKNPNAAPQRNKVIFNEIAWMGTTNSANDEWIELKNISGEEIDLTGWQLLDKDQQIKIVFGGERVSAISANGFLLLERTNDETVPGIAADLIYTGGLNNSDEAIYLFDKNCQLQDFVEANPNWPAGDNSSKRTMERKFDLTWQTSSNPGGTPKRENSAGYVEIPSVVTGGGGGGSAGGGGGTPPPPASQPTSYPKILISEIQIASQTNEKDDFVELFNPNDSDLDLTSWYLQRKTKGSEDFSSYAPESLFSGKVIKTHGYFLIANAFSTFSASATTTYPLTEDNTLYLKNPNGQIVDKVGWGNAQDFETATTTNPPAGQSTGRKWSTTTQTYIDTDNNREDFEIQTPTPKAQNQSPPSSPSNQPPNAIFTYSPANPIINQEIVFNGSFSTDTDGVILSYFWDFNEGTSTGVTTTYSYLTSGTFTVTLLITDERGATSSTSTIIEILATPTVVPPTHILITEVRVVGTNEFVEIYNPTDEATSTTGWYLSYFPSDNDWNSPSLNKSFSLAPTTTIPAKSYFLIAFGDYTTSTIPIPDWKPYQAHLDGNSGAIGIFSGNPATTTTSTEAQERAKSFKIDVLGWGNPIVKEGTSTESTTTEKSFARKIATTSEGVLTYIDSDNNSQDFEIQGPTPKARNQHQFPDLDGDGVIDSYDSTTTITTTIELKAGEYKFKDLVIIGGGKLILNSSTTLSEFKGVKILAENLIIDASSSISADGLGYGHGEGLGAGTDGERAGGGGYGGRGGDGYLVLGGQTYGSSTLPFDLGSGGGDATYALGGAGGGVIWIEVTQTLTLNGTTSANGTNGGVGKHPWAGIFTDYGGGGSGGSIYITTNVLTGSGLIQANGGKGGYVDPGFEGGGGGGGRIAIYYQTNNFNGNLQSYGGLYNKGGGAGTIYLKSSQTLGDLILDNGNISGADSILEETELAFNNLKILNKTKFILPESLTANEIEVRNATLEARATSTILSLGDFNLNSGSFLIGPTQIFIFLNINNDFIIQSESRLIGNFNIRAKNITIATSSSILADGKGYPHSEGLGAGTDGERAGGGGYGGRGGDTPVASGGQIYGSTSTPTDFGSGGGDAQYASGGLGGGAIWLEVSQTLTLDGRISANGTTGGASRDHPWATVYSLFSGGGSGGSVYITSNAFTGSGLIQANGGKGGYVGPGFEGGGGGGGRIVVYYREFDGANIEVLGGQGSYSGEQGTKEIILK